MTRWWGGGTALLLAALLPAACTEKIVLEHPVGGSGGGGGAFGLGGAAGNGGGNSDASTDHSGHCPGGVSNSLSYEQESPQIMIALDRSPSMGEPLVMGQQGQQHWKISLAANAITDVLGTSAFASVIQFGYVEFPGSSNDSSCANGCCATGLIQPVPPGGSFNQLFNELGSCVNQSQVSCSGSQATPTAQALSKIASTFHRVTGALYAVVITDGPPNTGCPLDPLNTTDNACDQAANQIFTMRNGPPPISTFVMVLGTPPDDPNNPGGPVRCLSNMAIAGGHVLSGSPSPTYIQSLTESSVDANLTTIVRSTICRIDITQQFFDPNVDAEGVTVEYNGTPVNPDPPNQPGNGWSFDPSARSTIVLNGNLCDNVINKGASRHLAVKGCLHSSTPFPSPAR